MTGPLSLIPKDRFVKHHTGKFAPKLNDEERCAVLALVRSGVRRESVAAAYGIDRRTVGHISNTESARYKEVRAKYKAMGHEEFVRTFLTEEAALKIAALPADETTAPKVDTSAPSPRANRLAGSHKVKPEQCEYEHRIEIKYCKAEDETGFEGWHFRDLDSKNPENWFHNGDESRRTSQSCYDAMLENLMDD